MIETNKVRRGHRFFPTRKIPKLYETEKVKDKIAYEHYFVGSADWYVFEYDAETGEAFGWAQLFPGGGELGYFNLVEIEGLKIQGWAVVERDLHWTPKVFDEDVRV